MFLISASHQFVAEIFFLMNILRLQLLFRKANETADVVNLLSSLVPWEESVPNVLESEVVSECLSITPFSSYRWARFLLLRLSRVSAAALFPWQQTRDNLHVGQTTNGTVRVRVGGEAWQFAHDAVSSRFDPTTSPHVCFHRDEVDREGINLIPIPLSHNTTPLFLSFSHLSSLSRLFRREITMLEGSPSSRPSTSVETNWTTRSRWQFVRLRLFRNGCLRQGSARRWRTVSVWVNT